MNDKKKILVFLGITFVFSWTLCFFLWKNGGLQNSFAVVALSALMLIPALSSLLTRLITREGFMRMWLKPNFKRDYRVYLIAWFGPGILILLGSAFFFLIFPQSFDSNFSTVRKISESINASANQTEISNAKIQSFLLMQVAIGLLFAPILNFIPCLGEELGWRGYLLPKLSAVYGKKLAALYSGIIWGIWHAPVIAMGHNYGVNYAGYPYLGIFAMILFCVFVGFFFAWMAFSTESAIAPALAHGALNGMAGIGIYLCASDPNPFTGPLPTGFIGGIGFIIVGILCYRWICATAETSPVAVSE